MISLPSLIVSLFPWQRIFILISPISIIFGCMIFGCIIFSGICIEYFLKKKKGKLKLSRGWIYIDTAILWGSTVRYRIYAPGGGKWASCAAGLRNGPGQTAGIQEAELGISL
jgi:hypothetical protein